MDKTELINKLKFADSSVARQDRDKPTFSPAGYPIFDTSLRKYTSKGWRIAYELTDPVDNRYEYQTMDVRRLGTKRFVNLLNVKSLSIETKLAMYNYAVQVYGY
mgnify:CR=1 FL=1